MKIKIKVKPNSLEESIEDKGDFYLVRLKKPARDGKANAELLKLLKRKFKKNPIIKSGYNSRTKVVELE